MLSAQSQQNINHFINSDHWSFRELMDQVATSASQMFAQHNSPVALLIDELGFRKKGKMSACVGRQYLGCIGKTDNGQVAVGAVLSQQQYFVPIDMRLFMPDEWDKDEDRRLKCNIPDTERHLSKPRMAQEMIQHALDNHIRFDYVNFDALYGNALFLLDFLQSNQVNFIGDIRSDFTLYFKHKDDEEKCRVDEYVASLCQDDFEKINIRKSTKGALSAYFHYAKTQVVTTEGKWLDLILLVRMDEDGKTKYSLCNMDNEHIQELAQKQSQRIFVEQAFRDGKNLVGMGDYQIRGWVGFHNHIALCMMAMLLLAKIKLKNRKNHFTAPVIRKVICLCIKSKLENPSQAFDIILNQHHKYLIQLKKQADLYNHT